MVNQGANRRQRQKWTTIDVVSICRAVSFGKATEAAGA
jgi:hypothetical protein